MAPTLLAMASNLLAVTSNGLQPSLRTEIDGVIRLRACAASSGCLAATCGPNPPTSVLCVSGLEKRIVPNIRGYALIISSIATQQVVTNPAA